MKYVNEADAIHKVIDAGLCCGCGSCTRMCSSGAVSMRCNPAGFLVANVDDSLCVRCELCVKVCPMHEMRQDFQDREKTLRGTFLCRAVDAKTHAIAQSGGVVTAILKWLLETRRIDGAIVTKFDSDRRRAKAVFADTAQKIDEAAGSCYCQSSVVEAALEHKDSRLAVVALGCHAQSIAKLVASGTFKSPPIVIGLVCESNYSGDYIDALCLHSGIALGMVRDFRFKDKSCGVWPGDVMVSDGSKRVYVPHSERLRLKKIYEAPCCIVCKDKMNAFADIVAGDPWGFDNAVRQAGRNVVLTRTEIGARILADAMSSGAIEGVPVQADRFFDGQGVGKNKKFDLNAETRLQFALSVMNESSRQRIAEIRANKCRELYRKDKWKSLPAFSPGRSFKVLAYGFWLDRNFGGPSLFHGLDSALSRLCQKHELAVYQPTPVDPVSVSDANFRVKEFPYRRRPLKLYRDWLLLKLFGRKSNSKACAAFWSDFMAADAVAFAYPICFCSKIKTAVCVASRLEAIRAFFTVFGVSLLARISGKASVKTTASFGPSSNAGNRLLARLACRFAFTRIVAREESGRRELIDVAKATRDIAVAPDLANLWLSGRRECDSNLLGISVSYQLREQWFVRGLDYVSQMARLIEHAVGKFGCKVVLVPNQCESPKPGRTDIDIANEIIAALPTVKGISVVDCRICSPTQLRDAIASCSAMVTARYHSCVAGFVSGVPQLILGWHDKYQVLSRLYGQEGMLLPIESCSEKLLREKFDALWTSRKSLREEIVAKRPNVETLVLGSVRHLFDDAYKATLPKVSVIIPVYNVEKEICRSLDSILAQTLKRIEIICVDDGSSDSSAKVVEKYAKKDSRIRLVRQQNSGAGAARNKGMEVASGEFLYFMDSDDACDKTMLEKMVRKAVKTGADIVITQKIFVDPDTFRPSKVNAKPFPADVAHINGAVSPREVADRLFTISKSVPWDKLFRSSFIRKNNLMFQDIKRSNDVYFVDMALVLAERIAFLPECLYFYTYKRGASLTEQRDHLPFEPLVAYDAVESSLRVKGLWDIYAKSFVDAFAGSVDVNLRDFKRKENYDRFLEIAVDKLLSWGRCDLVEVVKSRKFFKDSKPHAKVSVVVPVYNVAKYLPRCLDSLFAQTLKNIEVICVDDGSTDGSAAILEEYARKDPRIIVVRQDNAGAGAARNAGIEKAGGEYIFFFDPDDSCEKDMLDVMYRKARKTKSDVVVAGKKIVDADTGELIADRPLPRRFAWRHRGAFAPDEIADVIFSFAKAVPWDKMFRRAFVEEKGLRFMPLPRSNDVYFVDMALALAKRIALVRKGYYRYSFRRGGSLTFSKDRHPLSTIQAYEAIEAALKEHGVWERFRISFAETFFKLIVNQLYAYEDKGAFSSAYQSARSMVTGYSSFARLEPSLFGSPALRRRAEAFLRNEKPDVLWEIIESDKRRKREKAV